MSANVHIESETEHACGWTFVVLVEVDQADGEAESRHVTMTLSWADYDLWSKGTVRPETVARACVRFLIDRRGAALVPARFDAAHLRRWFADADEVLGQTF